MLTAYDQYAAEIFDQAGVPVLLVGDSAANNVYGYESTLRITVDELVPLVRTVVRSTTRALIVADMPFGSYEAGPERALDTAVRFMKETGAQAVKLEGGHRVIAQVEALVSAGIPVMGHIGLTPQSVNVLGGSILGGLSTHVSVVDSQNTILGSKEVTSADVVGPVELPATADGEFYVFQLTGLTVEEEGGRALGRVQDVAPGVANDVLELDTGLALPLVEDCVLSVDLERGLIVVAPGFGDQS